MDQMVSVQPGLIPQMAGFLTNLHIWGATVFIDHLSDYVYVALMQDLGLDKTLLAKSSFEQHANEGGISINAYRANNCRFADDGFQKAIKEANQSITFCAVGAHHQNGIVERRINELIDATAMSSKQNVNFYHIEFFFTLKLFSDIKFSIRILCL